MTTNRIPWSHAGGASNRNATSLGVEFSEVGVTPPPEAGTEHAADESEDHWDTTLRGRQLRIGTQVRTRRAYR
jgi:hypothetical protein